VDGELSFEVTPAEVQERRSNGEPLILIDVRRPDEHLITRIETAELIPMDTVPQRLNDLEEMAEQGALIVFCHHGVRSATVVNWLRGQGVANSQSMAGGIDRWSLEIDSSVPRY